MNIPQVLQNAIEEETVKYGSLVVAEAREALTERYRRGQPKNSAFMTTDAERAAYLAARLPATYAVIRCVLQEVQSRLPETKFDSLLDLGAGPGTVMWAAAELFPDLVEIDLVELDSALASIGKRLASYSEQTSIRTALWQIENMAQSEQFVPHDLVVMSYSVGELSTASLLPLIEKGWQATAKCLVVIEPGTPAGFERIRLIRDHLIRLGGYMVAPCPHAGTCPMAGGDWCHFSERVERSSFHRRIKGGSLGHEDEKYSYVAVSRTPCDLPNGRILRHPQKHSGHINLILCTPDGLKETVISKRTPALYKQARKAEWGFPFNNTE